MTGSRARRLVFAALLLASSCGYDGPRLDVEALKAKLDADPNALQVIDVRQSALFAKGHIEGAKSVPLEEIDAHLDELAAARRPMAVVCTCGKRSLEAIGKLRARGVEPFLVVGGMKEWEKAGYPVER